MSLVKHNISSIVYTKKDKTTSNRDIIPTSVPGHVKAIDVSDMDVEDRQKLLGRLEDYSKYTKEIMASMMTFENWLEATHKKDPIEGIKWRTFIAENISEQ